MDLQRQHHRIVITYKLSRPRLVYETMPFLEYQSSCLDNIHTASNLN
jgi:hypothetical protein